MKNKFLPLCFGLLCACTQWACGGSARALPVSGLDYTEIRDATGWSLRVYGNGSGSISHAQLPAYHLHYPRATFPPTPHPRPRPTDPRLSREPRPLANTATTPPENCVRVAYYSALQDTLLTRPCVTAAWPRELMVVAIDRMEYALEAGGSERSCRMLRRHWLVSADF